MEPSVTEESLATKLCEVFGISRGDSVWAGHLYQLHQTIIFFFDPEYNFACALAETMRPSSRLWFSSEEYLGFEHYRSGWSVSDSYRISMNNGIE